MDISDEAARPALRVLGLAVMAFVIASAFQVKVHPGEHGRGLGITISLIAFGAFMVAVVWSMSTPGRLQVLPMIGVVLSTAALVGFQPNGPGFLGLFPAVSASALRLPTRTSAWIAALAMAALPIAYAIGGHQPGYGIALNEIGVAAFYILSIFARRFRESDARTKELLHELEQTRDAQAQAAALGERARLAREMHDVLAHTLSGLVLNLEGARLLAEKDRAGAEVEDAIERAHRLAKTGVEEARRAIGMLRDDALPGPQRLAGLAADFEASSGVACTLSVEGDERELGSDGRLTLYRVAQEALTNITKHARPSRVELHLSYEASGTRLTIEDFSSGERPPPGDGTGYGLTGMRERAELLGGSLTAGATATGFRVELWVPA